MNELSELIARHCLGEVSPTPIPRLALHRAESPTRYTMATPPPLFCVVAQGSKRVALGLEEFTYDPKTYLITSADLPVAGQITVGPMLGMSFEIDPAAVAELVVGIPPRPLDRGALRAVGVGVLDAELYDAVVRLVRLLDRPQDIATLFPLLEREILYRLLLGPKGEILRQLALPGSQLSQVNRAINFIRRRYDQSITVEELAELASMSAPTFHRHFRAVTGMSPIQFQKRIRLQEARRQLLTDNEGAANVAIKVGYDSPSQFSREYRRLFGAPPAQDTSRLRRELVQDPIQNAALI